MKKLTTYLVVGIGLIIGSFPIIAVLLDVSRETFFAMACVYGFTAVFSAVCGGGEALKYHY